MTAVDAASIFGGWSRAALLFGRMEVSVTGAELREIRVTFGLSASAMGRALGFSGANANIAAHIRRLEREARPIPPPVARLAEMFWREGIPQEWST